ncbi:YCF48-related protein [Pseudomonadota bacterium]|nr:YCF48-related protein [Pseudomonadota bacterium]|tara:strand:- start:431 stop:1519 length:1089 start_codon:yes stop_codon:yes gene_type:complete
MKSYSYKLLFWVFLAIITSILLVSWGVNSNKIQSKPVLKISQSNIKDHKGERIRFVQDNLFAIDFIDQLHGWAAGYYGTILKTIDGGRNWIHISLPNTDLVRRIQFLNKDYGWLVTHRGRIMNSIDGGSTWKTLFLDKNNINLRNIRFLDSNVGWAVGHEGTILYTNDGGQTWTYQFLSNYTGRDLPRLNGLTVLSKTRAMLAGEFGVIAETINAGKTWTVISSPDIKATFTEIEQVGNLVLAVGLDGVIAQVNSNKLNLQATPKDVDQVRVKLLNSEVNNHLFDIATNKNGEGIVVGLANILAIKNGNKLEKIELDLPDLNYLYFMGATSLSESKYALVGARGLAITIDTSTAEINGLVKW